MSLRKRLRDFLSDFCVDAEDETFVRPQVDLLFREARVIEVGGDQRFSNRGVGRQGPRLLAHVERDQHTMVIEPTFVGEHMIGGGDEPEAAERQHVIGRRRMSAR